MTKPSACIWGFGEFPTRPAEKTGFFNELVPPARPRVPRDREPRIADTALIETRRQPLDRRAAGYHALGMFLVTEAAADAIRAIFNQEGELSAAIELRRRFPGITDNAKARAYVRTIAGWKLPPSPCPVIRLRPRKDS